MTQPSHQHGGTSDTYYKSRGITPSRSSWHDTSWDWVTVTRSQFCLRGIIRPRCLHAVYEMRSIATDVARSVVCLPVCLLETRESCAKTAELIDMPFRGLTYVYPRDHVLDGFQYRINPFAAARGDRLIWTLIRIWLYFLWGRDCIGVTKPTVYWALVGQSITHWTRHLILVITFENVAYIKFFIIRLLTDSHGNFILTHYTDFHPALYTLWNPKSKNATDFAGILHVISQIRIVLTASSIHGSADPWC